MKYEPDKLVFDEIHHLELDNKKCKAKFEVRIDSIFVSKNVLSIHFKLDICCISEIPLTHHRNAMKFGKIDIANKLMIHPNEEEESDISDN